MKDKRIHNDLNVMWSIFADGAPFSLEGKQVTIYLRTPYSKKEIVGYSISGNVITWKFLGKDQKHTGKHSLELVINEDAEGMVTTDACDFVNLVDCSCKVGGNDDAGVQTESIELTSTLEYVAGSGGGESYDDTYLRTEVARLEKEKADKTEVAEQGRKLDELSSEIQQISEKVEHLPQGASMTPITYADLVNLRDNGELVAGAYYRITDYVTTTAQENTQSANHPFDVIVLALSENTLAEEAYAIQSERDTDGYFANSKLSAWKLWYCLDNDTERFAWADTDNGKGVIYRMIDEFENDIPYDFKNIQFRRKINLDDGFPQFSEEAEETWVYTFCANSYHINNDEWSELKDGSLESPYGHMSDENSSTFHHNSMKSWIMYYNGNDIYQECGKAYLNDNVFLGYWEELGSGNEEDMPYYYAYCCYGNSFGNNCIYNSFGNNCFSNSFKDQDGMADNASYNKLDDGVNNIELWYDDNNGNYGELKNHHVCRGCTERQIEIYENRDFETTFAMTSDGQFREYCIADVV